MECWWWRRFIEPHSKHADFFVFFFFSISIMDCELLNKLLMVWYASCIRDDALQDLAILPPRLQILQYNSFTIVPGAISNAACGYPLAGWFPKNLVVVIQEQNNKTAPLRYHGKSILQLISPAICLYVTRFLDSQGTSLFEQSGWCVDGLLFSV